MSKVLGILLVLLLVEPFCFGPAASGSPSSRTFSQVRPGYEFEFPRDHFSHEDFRIEWWYFTGNLSHEDRRFGYELTFFRFGFDRESVLENPSVWSPRDLYIAHFALSDIARERFTYSEKSNRSALGRAGADAKDGRVYNGEWRWELGPTWSLAADDGENALLLELKPLKGPVLHGRMGYSPKGTKPGEASYYYSLTRIDTQGTLRVGSDIFQVHGLTWMDREFTSARLDPEDKEGWDWFSIQLDNDTELMLYLLRYKDRSRTPYARGTIVHPDGTWTILEGGEFRVLPTSFWRSRQTKARYPVAWDIEIPGFDIRLRGEAAFPEQELVTERSTNITYWEGSAAFQGTFRGRPVLGRGYVEMTGYAGPMRVGP